MDRLDLTPDPRISDLRPAWLTDDEQWRDQLQSLPYDDAMWFERHWKMASGAEPTFDMSWVTTETIGGSELWSLVLILGVGVVMIVGLVWTMVLR